ncbi:MAG: UDP-N-acetylmuramate--alanine ligase [Fibrobacteria bacterium]|nr:UDP-N-acetylmuramate--alanine ligase [Fibrobacteria bacterium]
MSALAQYLQLAGKAVTGSDRAFDQGKNNDVKSQYLKMGMKIYPQNGSGITPDTSCLIYSTAIENSNPELQKAKALNIPTLHRSDLLAQLTTEKKSIAVSGTSGKSTVTAMIYQLLESAQMEPSILTGANLLSLEKMGLPGNAVFGKGDWLVFEADESDGSLVKYSPEIGLILNIEKDHKEISELIPLFTKFGTQIKETLILNVDDKESNRFHSSFSNIKTTFFSQNSFGEHVISELSEQGWASTFTIDDTSFTLNMPGKHNIANAMASLQVAQQLGVSLSDCAHGLSTFTGIDRRHIFIGKKRDITVIDDFAHNPAKVQACIRTVKHAAASGIKGAKVIAIFHPHGFAPMKLLRKEFVEAFTQCLDERDILLMPEIYYAGGTADKSISSQDILSDINSIKKIGHYFTDKDSLLKAIPGFCSAGDIIVSMGARDPSLSEFAQKALSSL